MPFLWIALSFIAGIAAASELGGGIGWWLAGLGITFFIGVGILIGKRYPAIAKLGWIIPVTKLPACLLPIFILLGGVLYLTVQPHHQPGDLFYYNDSDRTLSITAEVTEPPDYRTRSTLAVLKIINFSVGGTTYPGGEKVMSMMPANTPLEYGDRLTLHARPETPFEEEDFSYREYLATKQIFTILSYPRIETRTPASSFLPGLWLYRFRAHLIEITARIFPAPESGLITGIILGPRNNISDDLYNAFRNSGTSHIIAISGFNIAILAALISVICLSAFGHWKGAITALIAIALYAMLVGGGASVIRASIMGGLAIMAQQIGRKQAGLNTLALTAFVMLTFNPMLLWDVGFQLSFFATLGLVWFASPFQEAFKTFAARYIPEEHLQRVADWTGEYFLFTIAAQITTLPVLLYHFHQVPFALLIANPLVLPAQPPLMGFSAAAMAAGLIWLPLGRIVGLVAVPFTTYTAGVPSCQHPAGFHLRVLRAAGGHCL
jgi:competence protein ComEC